MPIEITLLCFAVLAATVMRDKKGVPPPVTLLLMTMGYSLAVQGQWLPPLEGLTFQVYRKGSSAIADHVFDLLVFATLPLLIAADAMKLHFDELRKNAVNLFALAVGAIVLSVLIGSVMLRWLPGVAQLFDTVPTAGLVMIMAMLCATDPITVGSIFSRAPVPHQLKFITEGESLFNDATALVLFSLALSTLNATTTLTAHTVAATTLFVFLAAVAIGIFFGTIAYFLMRTTEDPMVETCAMLFAAYGSYQAAESVHASGILAVIVATLLITYMLRHSIFVRTTLAGPLSKVFDKAASTAANFEQVCKHFDFLALLASTALFLSIALSIDYKNCLLFWKESLVLFVLGTSIRALSLAKVAVLAKALQAVAPPVLSPIPRHWLAILTFAGSKGALSLVMLHLIPSSATWLPLAEALVVNNVILSILVYAPILMTLIHQNRAKLAAEAEQEAHSG